MPNLVNMFDWLVNLSELINSRNLVDLEEMIDLVRVRALIDNVNLACSAHLVHSADWNI